MFQSKANRLLVLTTLALTAILSFSALFLGSSKKIPPTKSIRGRVTDTSGNPIRNAKVFITKASKKTTTVVVTDDQGQYAINGLDPKEDYEVYAESGSLLSEKRMASQFLTRMDNLFNFELRPGGGDKNTAAPLAGSKAVVIKAQDGFPLNAELWLPEGTPPKGFPAVLLLPDFNDNRSSWNEWIPEIFLKKGYAVLNADLRGHGVSQNPGETKSSLDPSWKDDPTRFLPDLGAILEWMRQQDKIDSDRIALAGYGFGADLVFLASGKYELVRAAIAISPTQSKTAQQAESITNFQPHTILYIVAQGDANALAAAEAMEAKSGYPRRTQVVEKSSARGLELFKTNSELKQVIAQWLGNSQ